jgi:hypothetical protein
MNEKPPNNIDLGASAKLEIKTEVPAEASGRLTEDRRQLYGPVNMMG